jgi:serine/threonine-protein kinase
MLIGTTIGSGDYRFEIESELGSGAMGTVYRARFHEKGAVHDVALKVVALGLLGNESAMARFTRESSILKQLRHPHIVKLRATGQYRKTPFIAMEFIDGEALDRVLARRGRLSWEEVAAFGKQLCEALQYAHEKGIIHRDLKPSNLMITSDEVLKLTDFGIAKDTDVTALTGANSTIGTAAYMSPEQCKGDKSLTHKSDLYSLGIVFFELLTGKKPFYADTTVDMFLKHVNETPPRIGKLLQDLPGKFEALILQLLEKDKEDRPIDAAWVGRLLGEIEDDAFARKSAGLDAASARKIDRRRDPGAAPIDEADREAARALKGEKKKKRRKKAVPFLQQKWVKAVGILGLLVGMAAGVYYAFLKSPPPDKLFAAIEAAKDPASKLEAATAFLKSRGDIPGPQTEAAAAVFREGKVREREKQLANRHGNRWRDKPEDSDDPDAYRDAMAAIDYEKAGHLKDAAATWTKVKERFPEEARLSFTFDEAKLARARWGWVADKRLKDIQSVEEYARRLQAKIDENRRFELDTPYNVTNPELVAIKALRLEQFAEGSDKEKAGKTWDTVITLTEKEPDQRVVYLLACKHKADVPKEAGDNSTGKRQALIKKQIAETEPRAKELKNDPDKKLDRAQVRILCRELAELYDDETDKQISDAVKRAREIIAELPKT